MSGVGLRGKGSRPVSGVGLRGKGSRPVSGVGLRGKGSRPVWGWPKGEGIQTCLGLA